MYEKGESDKGEERCEVYQSGGGGLSNESSGEMKGGGKKERLRQLCLQDQDL